MTSSSPPHVSAPQSHAEGNPLSYHHSCTWICTYVHLYTYATLDPFVRRATTAVSRSCSWPSYPGIPHRPRRPQPLDRIPDKGGLYRRMATAGAGGWAGSGEERGGITRRGEREGASLEWFPTRPKTRVSVRGVGDGRNLMYTYVWRSSRNATRCGKCQWATTLCAKRGVGHAAAALRRAGYWPRGELVQLHGRRRTRDATPAGLGMAGRCQQPARLDGVPLPPPSTALHVNWNHACPISPTFRAVGKALFQASPCGELAPGTSTTLRCHRRRPRRRRRWPCRRVASNSPLHRRRRCEAQ